MQVEERGWINKRMEKRAHEVEECVWNILSVFSLNFITHISK